MRTNMAVRKSKKWVDENRVYVGKILRSHALKGAVKIKSFDGERRLFERVERIHVENPDENLVIEHVQRDRTGVLAVIRHAVFARATAAEEERGEEEREVQRVVAGSQAHGVLRPDVRGQMLLEPEELPELEEGLVYESDILFAEVQTVEGECLGRVEEIIETGEHDVMVIRDGDREILLPATLEVIVEIRRAEHTIRVKPPAGLEA